MDRQEAFKKIMVMFKRGDITPQQLGTLMGQYYERYVVEPSKENKYPEFDGKLGID